MIGTDTMRNDLDGLGYGVVRNLLSKQECGEWICAYGDSRLFRKKIIMEARLWCR